MTFIPTPLWLLLHWYWLCCWDSLVTVNCWWGGKYTNLLSDVWFSECRWIQVHDVGTGKVICLENGNKKKSALLYTTVGPYLITFFGVHIKSFFLLNSVYFFIPSHKKIFVLIYTGTFLQLSNLPVYVAQSHWSTLTDRLASQICKYQHVSISTSSCASRWSTKCLSTKYLANTDVKVLYLSSKLVLM